MPRPIDWIAALFYVGVLVLYGYFIGFGLYPVEQPWLAGTVVFFTILILLALDRFEYWHYGEQIPWKTAAILLLVRLTLIWAASLGGGLYPAFPAKGLLPLLVPFGFFFLSGNSYGLSGFVWIVYLTGHVRDFENTGERFGGEFDLPFVFIFFLSLVFIGSIAYTVRQERTNRVQAEKLLHDLAASHRQLQDYAEQVAELATTEERNRLAREIHDSLGHYMTVINVQLEKAIAFRTRNPQEADQAVKDAKHLAGEALKDVRRSVGALRNAEPFSLAESLTRLVNNIGNDQFSIDLHVEGEETGFSKQSLVTLFRAAQEGLTNIQKHAGASQVTVRIKLEAQAASLYIDDNGQGFEPASLDAANGEAHYGLQGVQERLELIRGSLKLESRPDKGTTILIIVPKNPLALVGAPGS